ncbi:MAG: hypothetical protein AAFN93_02275 [Bacteroidota bacterium]
MYKITLFALLFVASINLQGQNIVAERIDPLFQNQNVLYNSNYAGIKGSPYLSDDWNNGVVVFNNGQKKDVQLKYDLYIDELIVKQDGRDIIVNKSLIQGFNYISKEGSLEFRLVKLDKNGSKKFLQLLSDGSLKLYREYELSIKKGEANTGYASSKNTSDKFIKNEKYLYQKNGEVFKLSSKAKKIAEISPENKVDINAFIKKEKISAKRERDLIKLFEYINGLNAG